MHRGSPSGDQSMTLTLSGRVRPSPTSVDGSTSFAASLPLSPFTTTGEPNPPPSPLSEAFCARKSLALGSGNTTLTFHSGDVVLSRVAVLRVIPPYVSSQYGLLVLLSLFVAGSRTAPATSTTKAPPGPLAAAMPPSIDLKYAFSKS